MRYDKGCALWQKSNHDLRRWSAGQQRHHFAAVLGFVLAEMLEHPRGRDDILWQRAWPVKIFFWHLT